MAIKYAEVKIEAVAGMTVDGDVYFSPASLLELAQGLARSAEQKHWGLAVVVAHTACEVATERALTRMLIAARSEAEMEKVKKKFGTYGYSKIQVEEVQKLYRSLTRDDITEWSDWGQFDESIKNRNAIVHDGKDATQQKSRKCLELAVRFFHHLDQQTTGS